MKPVSNEFKQAIKQYGKQINAEITYNDGEEHLLNSDVLFSVTPTINGNILKSVMKQVDFESSVKIPKNTIINVHFGVKVGEDYEYINFGNYIVSKEPEYNADTQTYNHICYDKLLYSMKEYQRLDITYPITIREYINQFAQNLGLTFKNRTETFANYDKYIKLDLYDGQGYTFRDVLDELAEVTASTICINEVTDELEIRYLNDTQEIINEDYLKNINVEFAQMYGPINSIVLSRSGESDNVYLQNETSVQLNGLCELKIIDNQIMNDNDRSVFLADILDHLNGITYYINNFDSPGITWLELCDKYTVRIGTNQYNCVLFNNEIKITQGLEETIFTELPVASETDYTKADKTDRKINQTYLIVDKQNQKIESVVSQTTDTSNPNSMVNKVSQVTQTVNELNSKISDIADITTSKESTNGILSFEKVNQSEPIYVKIYPIGENISYLYPHANLFPSATLYPKVRTLRFTNTTTNEILDYELPTDLLYHDAENYDEFILDYDAQKCEVNKRVGYNADGTTYVLDVVQTIEYDFPKIELTDGDYIVELLGYHNAYLFVRLMSQNIYTTQFSTKAELNSEISQTTNEINLSVDKKLTSYPTTTQMNSAISVKANEITSAVSATYATKNELTTAKSEIKQTTDSITSEVNKKVGEDEVGTKIEQNIDSVQIAWNNISEFIKYINAEMRIYNNYGKLLMVLNKNGQDFYDDSTFIGRIGTNKLSTDNTKKSLDFDLDVNGTFMTWASRKSSDTSSYYWKWTYCKGGIPNAMNEGLYAGTNMYLQGYKIQLYDDSWIQSNAIYQNNNTFFIIVDGNQFRFYQDGSLSLDGEVFASNTSSDGRLKKNIEESKINATELIKEMPVRSFDWKKNNNHINAGFIAQEMEQIDRNFVIKEPVKDENENMIDEKYHMNELPIIATLVKGFQEQQQEIEELKEIIRIIQKEVKIDFSNKQLKIEKIKEKEEIKQYNSEIKKNSIKKVKPIVIKENREKNGIVIEKDE